MTQTATVTWHRIADTPPPTDKRILLCDARDTQMGSRSGMVDRRGIVTVPGYPHTGLKWWTHWAEYPAPAKMEGVTDG